MQYNILYVNKRKQGKNVAADSVSVPLFSLLLASLI